MQPFTTHRGRLAVLDWTDVNTDLIIPARYLKRIERTGFGPLLFADKRYGPGGAPPIDDPDRPGEANPDFPLNHPALKDATILVVGRNFGCGSSREHAVWAVMQAGFRTVIAPVPGEGFADIFESNAFNNGLLVIELPQADWDAVAAVGRQHPGQSEATIDLRDQTITLHRGQDGSPQAERRFSFQVPESHRHRLLQGLDAIAETLVQEPGIERYEHTSPAWVIPHRPTAPSH
jgi:3-isopropylmalate/(R)-2-methylmalate dehydratase small subunit